MSRLLIHKSPLGPLSIPGVLGEPEPGEPFEGDDDIAETLLEQGDLYQPAPAPEVTLKELREIAATRGIDLAGARTKAEVAAVIAQHDEPVVVDHTEEAEAASAEQADDPQEGGDQL